MNSRELKMMIEIDSEVMIYRDQEFIVSGMARATIGRIGDGPGEYWGSPYEDKSYGITDIEFIRFYAHHLDDEDGITEVDDDLIDELKQEMMLKIITSGEYDL